MNLLILRLWALLALPVFIAGCAGFSKDGGLAAVNQMTQERLGATTVPTRTEQQTHEADDQARALLAEPLSLDGVARVALLNNPGLRATYAGLGIAEADLVQAGRLSNPVLDYKYAGRDSGVSIERTLTFNLIQLLTMPLAQRMESKRFEQTKLQVANAALRVAIEARKAFVEAVAARQGVAYATQVKQAAEASAELARGMKQAGNWSALDASREQVFRAQAEADLARMTIREMSANEKLARLLGANAVELHLLQRLPDLPEDIPKLENAEEQAMQSRLDIQAGKMEASALAESLGLNKTTRFINVLDLGAVRNTDSSNTGSTGYVISVSIPLFDWGDARVAKAEALYMQAVHRLAERALNARSEVRESYQRTQVFYEVAKHYRDDIVPLRKKISDEHQLRYNGMLISVFELLADAREQVGAVNGYIEALKDYWLAEADLQAALGGKLPGNLPDAATVKGQSK